MQDDASFLGLNFSTRGKVKFFATTEWGVSLVRGGQVFNAGATTSGGGFPKLDDPQAGQVFGNRLGNVGVDFGPFGRIAVGKQWGVHSDVTLYTTDQFVVFGSQGSATYTAGTDGGFLGTGRADQTLTYRNTVFKVLRLGGQLQFRTAANSKTVDGAGVSAAADDPARSPHRRGLHEELFRRRDDREHSWAPRRCGVRCGRRPHQLEGVGGRRRLCQTEQRRHRAGSIGSRLRASDRLRRRRRRSSAAVQRPAILRLRRVQLLPAATRPIHSSIPTFNTKYGIAGVTVGIMPNMYAYVEARIFNDSVDAQGQEGFDVLAIGVHYGFTVKEFHRR